MKKRAKKATPQADTPDTSPRFVIANPEAPVNVKVVDQFLQLLLDYCRKECEEEAAQRAGEGPVSS